MRKAFIERVTTETQIKFTLTIEGNSPYEISTGRVNAGVGNAIYTEQYDCNSHRDP